MIRLVHDFTRHHHPFTREIKASSEGALIFDCKDLSLIEIKTKDDYFKNEQTSSLVETLSQVSTLATNAPRGSEIIRSSGTAEKLKVGRVSAGAAFPTLVFASGTVATGQSAGRFLQSHGALCQQIRDNC